MSLPFFPCTISEIAFVTWAICLPGIPAATAARPSTVLEKTLPQKQVRYAEFSEKALSRVPDYRERAALISSGLAHQF